MDRHLRKFVAAGATAFACLAVVLAQQVHRNGFETHEPSWRRGPADANFRETAHELTDMTAHSGERSEHIELTTEQGTFIHYTYGLKRAPIAEELNLSLWIKANRPGTQLLARLVLPNERNPNNMAEPLTALLRGDRYDRVGRWQRLELRRPVQLARQQQQLLQYDLRRSLNFTDAFVDQLVLNVYGGPGKTDVWIDDLEAGPVFEEGPFQTTSRPADGKAPAVQPLVRTPARSAVVEFRNNLLVGGRRFFFRGIRHSDTPLKALRDAGFNTVWFDYATPPERIEEAVDLGFWVVPALPATASDARLTSSEGLTGQITRFLQGDAVLFWDLGGGLVREQAGQVTQAAQVIRAADPQRPIGVDAWDGFTSFARNVDLVGVHRWPLMTELGLPQYREWMEQRLFLAQPCPFMWTWVQTHLPDWYTNLVYGQPGSVRFDEPIGPQPEQIRLVTYSALAAGCRGLGFWSDRFLADSHQGRDRLLGMALLNQELQMLEPLLATATIPPRWIDTSNTNVKAAVFRTDRGLLVLPMWLGGGSQYVPGQSAVAQLTLTVPEVPLGAMAWEVSPAEVRSLVAERVVGGTRVTVPEFGLTAALVFTADNNPAGLLVRLQEQVRRTRPLAAQWARALAEAEIDKTARVEAQLEKAGHVLPDGRSLMEDARRRLKMSGESWGAGDYREAYAEAERALRPLRILMRAQWEQAVKQLDTPVSSPYALSYFTLPRHWDFIAALGRTRPAANVLPGGDFETKEGSAGWLQQWTTLDEVKMQARLSPDTAKTGKQSLLLQIQPNNPALEPAALQRTYLAWNSPEVRLPPGSLVRITGWVNVLKPIKASVDGVMFFDSIGGEPLAERITAPTGGWRRFTHYRRVPASGTVSATLALTGLGFAYFDDIRIEPLVDQPPGPTSTLAPGR